jgi:hypothetical protein
MAKKASTKKPLVDGSLHSKWANDSAAFEEKLRREAEAKKAAKKGKK